MPGRIEFIRPVTMFLVQVAHAFGIPAASDSVFEVAVSEVVTNAVKHGCRHAEAPSITCELSMTNGDLTLRVLDNGAGFTPDSPLLPDIAADRIDEVPSSGYGLPLMQRVFPSIRTISVEGRFGLELALPCARSS